MFMSVKSGAGDLSSKSKFVPCLLTKGMNTSFYRNGLTATKTELSCTLICVCMCMLLDAEKFQLPKI